MTIDTSDLRQECAELSSFLATLKPADWNRRTSFYDWTVADEVMHLHQVDGFGDVSLSAPEAFPDLVAWVRAGQANGIELSQRMREEWGALPPPALFAVWESGWSKLADVFDSVDPTRRLPWFGPDIGVQSFVSARQMEVWAHGQDIFDLFGITRENADRIRTICDLGVRTHGWSFARHELERPAPPEVSLVAPSGAVWTWNAGAPERVIGSAEDFALVVTQRRHARDTALVCEGPGAEAWMRIAQCFAGEPRDWTFGQES
jgi:uncharacterized protein (TIGR03084 family)